MAVYKKDGSYRVATINAEEFQELIRDKVYCKAKKLTEKVGELSKADFADIVEKYSILKHEEKMGSCTKRDPWSIYGLV